jgi:hypothetical protein
MPVVDEMGAERLDERGLPRARALMPADRVTGAGISRRGARSSRGDPRADSTV